ncbi:hypothetical protein VE00_07327 [Pseudogymnoascus sp. WSF 3629]|nr:hypothetical protein VE00_07327 [Pseudogymnoascus sp. WSF 3629]
MVTVPSFDRVNWSSETERKPETQSSTMGNYYEETRALAEQAAKNTAINIALSEYCGIESTAYALAVMRPDGSVATFVSDEVKTDPKYLFTPAFHNEFLIASGRAPSYPMLKHESDGEASNDVRTARYISRNDSSYRKRTPPRSAYDDDCSTDSSMSPGSRKRLRATATRSRERAIPTLPTRIISIGDDAARDDVYRQCLKDMQQNGCKVLGKAWVKLLEPKKQSTYPYTKGASKRPPWWPAMTGPNKIRHKEPDHLHKRERIILLMHILGLIVNQDSNSVARQRRVDVAKLEEVTREAMATWFADREKPKNAEKRGFLTQLFRVLYKEERYRRGELDGSATVSVNDGAGTTDFDDDDDEDSDPSPQHHQAHPISPFLPTPSSSLSPSHPISSTAPADMQDYYPRIPLRSTYIPTTPNTTTGDDYADAPYPIHHHNGLTHNPHPQQPPIYPTRAWPTQEINIYTGGSPWPTSPAAASGPMQQYPFGMSTSSPPQQQGQGAVFLPPPMSQGYEDVNGARGSFDGGWEVI